MNQNPKSSNENYGHILVVSCPLQGHAAGLIKLSHQMIKFGSKVTFLTTEFLRAQMADATANSEIRLLSMPDGLELEDDRKDQKKLHQSIERVMPPYLEDLLKKTNQHSSEKISGIVIDSPLAWMLDIPKKMGIKTAIYWCSTPGCLALGIMIPQLLQAKIIDDDGTPLKNDKIQLLPNMPAITMTEFTWYFPGDINIQKSLFHVIKGVFSHLKSSDWIVCNWFDELDPSAHSLASNLLSVGPLLANGQFAGSFCTEDSSCLTWLDKQPPNSVIYVAFGSTSRFSQVQLNELAMGLELMGRPFLWVAWSGLCDGPFPAYSDEFSARVANRGKMVEWAPQEMVLGHPSIACFVTHCGWSSFMESLNMGVPLLCWPYFGDQMYTQRCICDAWKVGTSLKADENGIISRSEIKQKLEKLLSDGIVRENVLRLKEMARKSTRKGGSSWNNLEYLVQQMK
ncbi:UDP-glycosyltransferase 83A1 [Forsythia ovata]|uniref:Glycosyltransferase n=1 Tax=Forsythia ovata TaxID=205694 RepID=A0ABD1QSL2_9LAMI